MFRYILRLVLVFFFEKKKKRWYYLVNILCGNYREFNYNFNVEDGC